jgi:Protein of unknown function (DUF3105)
MANRAQEKEQRRRERMAAEESAKQAASRRRMLQIGGGAVLALAAIAAVVVVLAAGGSDSSGEGNAADVAAQARAAGCTFTESRSEGREHSDRQARYRTNPPTSGTHDPVAAEVGVYAPGNEPEPGNQVHALEHGRVLFQYKPGTPAADVAKLRAISQEELNGTPAYHTLFFQNNTNMRPQFAVTAWTRSLTCDRLTPQAEDAMRAFREQFTDKAPEFIP